VVRRTAFTLIELIFAIVIIAISVISLPMMNQAIAKGVDSNLVQEAIFAAATELNEAITVNWDENSIEPTLNNAYARVINVSGNCNTITHLMPGHIGENLHRKCLENNNTTPSDSSATTVDALDDMAHDYTAIFVNNTPSAEGYKKSYTSKVAVTRANVNFGGAVNSNMKKLTITIKDSTGDIITSLITYSANIGEIDYDKRTYQ